MIWLRRLVAVLLTPLSVAVLVALLVIFNINGTIGNATFYTEQLQKADVYNFLYDEALPTALDEAAVNTGAPIDISQFKEEITSITKETLPPDWIQPRVENAINQILPYILGDTESFIINVPIKDRVETAGQVIKDTLRDEDTSSILYDQAITYAAEQFPSNLDELPRRLSLSEEELNTILQTLVPQEWLVTQIEQAIDEIVPYMSGDSEHFTIRIDLSDRIDDAASVLLNLLDRPETYHYLAYEMVAPAINENIGKVVHLPFAVSLTDEEIASAFEAVLPQVWVREQLEDIVNQVMPYLKGDSDTFTFTVPVEDRKAVAIEVLGDLAEQKLEDAYNSLEECSSEQMLRDLAEGRFPTCRAPGFSYQEVRQALNIDFGEALNFLIGDLLPSQLVFTEDDLRQYLGEEAGETLDQMRQWIIGGWTYTDADMRRDLGEEDANKLNEIRNWIDTGFTLSEADLTALLMEGENTDASIKSFNEFRNWLGLARQWLFASLIIPIILLALIGSLGGRNPGSKVAWASVVLGLVGAIVYIACGPIYTALARPELHTLIVQNVGQVEGLAAVMMSKGSAIVMNAADAFTSTLGGKAVLCMGIAAAGLAFAVWHTFFRK